MKKIINWFKKRTASKILIVLFAALTIGFLVAGMWGPALIEFAFFLSWVALDLKNNAIDVQDNTIRMLVKDSEDNRDYVIFVSFLRQYWKYMYCLADAKVRFMNGKITAEEFGKLYNHYTDSIEENQNKLTQIRKKISEGGVG